MRLHVALGLLVATFVESYVSFASADPSPVDGRVFESTEIRLLREAEHIQEDRGVNNAGEAAEAVSHVAAVSKSKGGAIGSVFHAVDGGVADVAVKANEQLASAAAKSNEQVPGAAVNLKEQVAARGVAKSKDEVADGVAKSKEEVADALPKTKEELEAETKAAEAAKKKNEAGGHRHHHPSPLKVALVSLFVIALLGAITGWVLHMANKHEVATPLEPMSGSDLGGLSG